MSSVPLKKNQCLNILRSQTPFTSLVVMDYSIKQLNVQNTPYQNLFFSFTYTEFQAGTLLDYRSSITKQTMLSFQLEIRAIGNLWFPLRREISYLL